MSAIGSGDKFSATAAMVGYLYQARYALTETARRLSHGADFSVSIEKIDDVAFHRADGSNEQFQLKHHSQGAPLADASPDMWKTIRIWSERLLEPIETQFYLVTTGHAPDQSAAWYLTPTKRDVQKAQNALMVAARVSKNKRNEKGISAFLGLGEAERLRLVSRIHVFDNALTLIDLQQAQRDIFYMAIQRNRYDSFLERVEGWWLRKVYHHLGNGSPILAEELQHQIDDVRDQLRSDSLPIDDVHELLAEFGQAEVDHTGRAFALQLRLIDFTEPRILEAIRDWMRAMAQRSRWVREQLVVAGELERYERRLVDEWRHLHTEMCEELGDEAGDEQMVAYARGLFKSIRQLPVYLRPRCCEPAILRGSYHDLADKRRVGWHPRFEERLEQILALAVSKK